MSLPLRLALTWLGSALLGSLTIATEPDPYWRCRVAVPHEWKSEETSLDLGGTAKGAGLLINGDKASVTAPQFRAGRENGVALMAQTNPGLRAAPRVLRGGDAIVLAAPWEKVAADQAKTGGGPLFAAITTTVRQPHETLEAALSPDESAKQFRLVSGLAVELVLSEPEVRQPLHLSFDSRGRLWVVQALQYPKPAGLKEVARDKVWRTLYDRVPPPPPHPIGSPFRGTDKISIHEDADGNGSLETHRVFVDGLSLATSVAHTEEGVFVTQPPYLLFFRDKDRNDIPDGPPEVHLSGFGLEDTHSIANSLRWGPDGWLYGAHGSTVSAAILAPGGRHSPAPNSDKWHEIGADLKKRDAEAVKRMGQFIWRYHPGTRRFEIFAEGGGNAYGLEIDSRGRLYSGHNGGDTRGFHYVQGGYYRKGFEKHGELSNPHAFGYFEPMKHHSVERFTHQFIIYESDALPAQWRGTLLGVDVLHNNIVAAEVAPDGSTFKTHDLARPVSSEDKWFRPVMITDGPDGAVYVADWYDKQVNHYRNQEGQVDYDRGRVWRIKAHGAANEGATSRAVNLSELRRMELATRLGSPNRWQRETALRLLCERSDAALDNVSGLTGVGDLCLRFRSGIVRPEFFRQANPYLKAWTVRLIGDTGRTDWHHEIIRLATEEADPEVRSQLACTARRFPAQECLEIAALMARRDADAYDPHIPLLIWWAFESKCASDPDKVVGLFHDESLWGAAIVQRVILERLARRFAATETRADYLRCSLLLQIAPTVVGRERLLAGIEEAFKGRTLAGLPEELLTQLAKGGGMASLALRLRQNDRAAIREALGSIAEANRPVAEREALIAVLGEIAVPEAVPTLLEILADPALRRASLGALRHFGDYEIARRVLQAFNAWPAADRDNAVDLLASREGWALALLSSGVDVPLPVVRKMAVFANAAISTAVAKRWGRALAASAGEKETEMARVKTVLAGGEGVPKHGQETFLQRCATCHAFFGKGGKIGPDLTSYQRGDLDMLLLAIVAPGAEIREGFEATVIQTSDGAALTGFIADQDARVINLRDLSGHTQSLPRDRIATQQVLPSSLMPEGLIEGLDDQTLRDLFAYLRSTTPPF
ncbi:MAG: PVC-type heme-binding CxxCH protein [Verrucomicrobiales bacterium]